MKVPPIRPASTIMLLRAGNRAASLEVLMLRRSAQSAFAPDVFAFPGGALEAQDHGEGLLTRVAGLTDERLARMFRAQNSSLLQDPSVPPIARGDRAALVIAALRELFEEGGILFGASSTASLDARALQTARELLGSGSRTFEQVLQQLDIHLDASPLELFSEWITPPSEARRFHAHFFLARAGKQTATADRHETHDEVWIEPARALRQYHAGTFAMVYPTIKHVERLMSFRTVDDALIFAREKPIVRIMPDVSANDGFTLPAELERSW